jgi:drug/metabolite transporter (DMT)-like permease
MRAAGSSELASGGGRNAFKGIAWMLLTGCFFVSVTCIVRHLGTDMNPVQAAFIRYSFGLLFLSPVLLRFFSTLPPLRRLGLHAVRGCLHGTGVMLWFYAMSRIPIAQVTALGFTAPIFTTIGAALFLGERIRLRRVLAVLAGFAGVVVIVRPGLVEVDLGALAQLAAAPLFACSLLISKKLTETESNTAIVGLMGLFVTLTLTGPALYVWRPPTWEELGWLFLTALSATLGHISMVQAFRSTEITVTQPVTFLQLVWASILGFYLFGEVPDLFTWIGGAVIVASATYIAHREVRARALARRRPSAAAGGRA